MDVKSGQSHHTHYFTVVIVLLTLFLAAPVTAQAQSAETQTTEVTTVTSAAQQFVTFYRDLVSSFWRTISRYLGGGFTRSEFISLSSTSDSPTTVQVPVSNTPGTIICTSQAGRTQAVSGAQRTCEPNGNTVLTALAPSRLSTWVLQLGNDGQITQQLNCFDQRRPALAGLPWDFQGNTLCQVYAPGNYSYVGAGRYLAACRTTVEVCGCTPTTSYSCSGNTIVKTTIDARCNATVDDDFGTCGAPQFCSPGSPVCLAPDTMQDGGQSDDGFGGGLLDADPLVRSGDTAILSWNFVAGICRITSDRDPWRKDILESEQPRGARESHPIVQRTVFLLECRENGSYTRVDDAVVNVLPIFREF